jgi:GNAT superfamily N-acetyltransferase
VQARAGTDRQVSNAVTRRELCGSVGAIGIVDNDLNDANPALPSVPRQVGALFDRAGRAFTLLELPREDEAPMVVLYPVNGTRRAGYAWTHLTSDGDLHLDDIYLNPELPVDPESLSDWLRVLVTRRWPSVRLRGEGLGKGLLEYVIARARELGVGRIVGEVLPSGPEETPHLYDWYRRRGFTVTELPDGRARVEMTLRPKDKVLN